MYSALTGHSGFINTIILAVRAYVIAYEADA